ncbi:hypothetical protein WME76_20305 [Sorangium sp. So ce119]|uniref:hypothetical protein n=1 Tax=Sorangium sp. So ce119 TaxID=3133279 RepID=UPI003F63ACD3
MRTAPFVVMLPTNFSELGEPPLPPVPVVVLTDPAPPSPVPVVVEELVVPEPPVPLVVAPLLAVVPALELDVEETVVVLPAPPEPPAPPSPPSPPSEHPKRVATPSAIQVVPHSRLEESFLFILDFRELGD